MIRGSSKIIWPASLLLVFALALLGSSLHGDGWFWALGNSLGLLVYALLLILVINGRGGLGRSERHRWLGIAVIVTLVGHCAWFLIGDPITLEYLKLGAPHYMVAGLLSFGLLLLLSASSLVSYRGRSYSTYGSFRNWHKYLSVLAVVTALIHILLSGLYFSDYWQWGVLMLVSIGVYFAPKWLKADYSFQRPYIVLAAIAAVTVFVLIRMMQIPG